MFNEEYLESLPNEPLLAVSMVTDKAIDHWANLPANEEHREADFFIEAYAIADALIGHIQEVDIEGAEISGSPANVVANINNYFNALKSAITAQLVLLKSAQFKLKYQAKFGNVFAYEFSDGDLEKIQDNINQLRQLISNSELFEPDHKRRLLARLEKVQSELHKKMADLDRFWGLIGDAGIAIGKFGKDAKPFVDRIKEISDIAWRTQSRAEELPSDTPMSLLASSDTKA